MIQYETLILAIPEITLDESKQLEKQLDALWQKAAVGKISFERWGKYRLAQPVNKNNYGVYFLARYEVDPSRKSEILAEMADYLTLKASELVMRFMTSVIDTRKGLEYAKPLPLDEAVRDIDKFLKDNKLDSMVSKSASHTAEAGDTGSEEDLD